MNQFLVTLSSLGLVVIPYLSLGAEDDAVVTDSGAPLKVIVRVATAAHKEPNKSADSEPVDMFQFFYVLKPDANSKEKMRNDFYRIGASPLYKQEVGWIHKDDVVEWAHRQLLGLMPIQGRQRALFFGSREELNVVPPVRQPAFSTL